MEAEITFIKRKMAQLNSHDTTPMWSHCMSVTHWHDFKIPMTRQYQQISAKTNKYVVHTHCYTIPILPCTNTTKLMVHILSLASQPKLHGEKNMQQPKKDMERSLDVGWKMWRIIIKTAKRKSNSLLFRFSWMYIYNVYIWILSRFYDFCPYLLTNHKPTIPVYLTHLGWCHHLSFRLGSPILKM